jgi:hypothetical protein
VELDHQPVSFQERPLLLVELARAQRHPLPALCREAVGNLICLALFYDTKTDEFEKSVSQY